MRVMGSDVVKDNHSSRANYRRVKRKIVLHPGVGMITVDEKQIESGADFFHGLPGGVEMRVGAEKMKRLPRSGEPAEQRSLNGVVASAELASRQVDADDGRLRMRQLAQSKKSSAAKSSNLQYRPGLGRRDNLGEPAKFIRHLRRTHERVGENKIDRIMGGIPGPGEHGRNDSAEPLVK